MTLTPFKDIRKLAEERKGGKKALDRLVAEHQPKTKRQLVALRDDR